MSIKINYKSSKSKKNLNNIVLFVDENFNITGLKKYISNSEFSYISDLLKTSDLKKKLLLFEINSKKTIFLVSIKKDFTISDIESLGSKFLNFMISCPFISKDKRYEYSRVTVSFFNKNQ